MVACTSMRAAAAAAAAVLCMLLLASVASAASCTSGVIQIQPPTTPFSKCMSNDADRNSIKAICGAAFRVTVERGILRMVPLDLGSYNTSYVLPEDEFGEFDHFLFNCKDHNASGLLDKGSTTKATVMLYDNIKKPLSNFTKTGPNQVSLSVSVTVNPYRGDPQPKCIYNYTVVSGCVLDARPAAPLECAPGYILKTGRFGIKFCSPCPKATYSPGGSVTACIPCPAGTANPYRGVGVCPSCAALGRFAPKAGLTQCLQCSLGETHKWTDGKSECQPCPAGSFSSVGKGNQCVRCYAGKKCCTVNWDNDCPKCTNDASSASYTSIFALQSGAPASCLASDWAMCAPKIEITINGACQITVNNVAYQDIPSKLAGFNRCSFQNPGFLFVRGASVEATRDVINVGGFIRSGLQILGNVTGAASPYLDITVPSAKCTLRYRALTKPAAAILGAAPKPAPKAPCSAGKYIDTSTDTKPGPCLPCPPGTYSTKAGTTGACTPCPAGTSASKYGSTSCTKCPLGTVAATPGQAYCNFCSGERYGVANRRTCTICPQNTFVGYPGAPNCLGTAYGSVCCAAGACGSQPRCDLRAKFIPPTFGKILYPSYFRLKSSSLASPTCRNATFISCLPVGSKILVNAYQSGLPLWLAPIDDFKCAKYPSYNLVAGYSTHTGSILGTNRAVFYSFDTVVGGFVTYEVVTSAPARTLTMYLSIQTGFFGPDWITSTPAIRKECSATFELVSGYFLDVKPATGSKCPAAAKTVKVTADRTICQYCGTGKIKNKAGACEPCPKGTYQPLGDGTVCKPCLAGFRCGSGWSTPTPCSKGQFGTKPKAASCQACPAGTFSGPAASKSCSKCPALSTSPKGSATCSVPFQTKF